MYDEMTTRQYGPLTRGRVLTAVVDMADASLRYRDEDALTTEERDTLAVCQDIAAATWAALPAYGTLADVQRAAIAAFVAAGYSDVWSEHLSDEDEGGPP